MTFGDDTPDLDCEIKARLDKAMNVLRCVCMEVSPDGDVPSSYQDRMGLLFAGIAKITIDMQSTREMMEMQGEDQEVIDGVLNMALNDMIKCAVIVASKFSREEFESALPSFSRN